MNHSVLASLTLPPHFLRLELRVEASEFSALLPQRLLCSLPTGPLCTQSLAFKEEKQTEAGTVLALSARRSQGAEWGAGGYPGGWRVCTRMRIELVPAKGS